MICPNCGSKTPDDSAFCPSCGHQLASDAKVDSTVTSDTPASSPDAPAEQPNKKCLFLVLGLVLLLLATFGAGSWYFLAHNKDIPKQEEQQQDTLTKEKNEVDKTEEPAEDTSATRAADAYEAILANADSYFKDPWFDQLPDTDIMYTLVNLTADDVPELLLATHYSNIGSHSSGGNRILVFTYNEKTGTAIQATSADVELFAEPYNLINYNTDKHALIEEWRYVDGINSLFNQITVEDEKLVRTQLEEALPESEQSLLDFAPIDDRTSIEQLQGNETQPQKEEQNSNNEQEKLRADAEAMGKTVLTGQVLILHGEEAIAYTGEGTFYVNGDKGTEANAESWYALLLLDTPTEIADIVIADSTTSGTYECILLGSRRYNPYTHSYDGEDGIAMWEQYNSAELGSSVCIAASNFAASAGTDYPGLPWPREATVLYTVE